MNAGTLFLGLWLGFVLGVFVAAYLVVYVMKDTYKQGQIDGLKGKWSYRLKTNQVEVVERIKE